MGDNAVFAAQQRRVTEQLGAAMLAAVGLMVRQYLGVPTGENEGQDSADAAWEDGAQAFRAGETVNESFDMARYLRLRQGASAAELEESEGRADAEDRSWSVRRTAEKTTSARTAAGDAGARGRGDRSASAAAPGLPRWPGWRITLGCSFAKSDKEAYMQGRPSPENGGGGLVSVSESPIECTGGRFLNEISPLLQLRLDA